MKLLRRWDGFSFLCYVTPNMASLRYNVMRETNCSGFCVSSIQERQVAVLTLSAVCLHSCVNPRLFRLGKSCQLFICSVS